MKKNQSFDVIRSLNESIWKHINLKNQLILSKIKIDRLIEKLYEITPPEEWKELDQSENIMRYRRHLQQLDADIYYIREYIKYLTQENKKYTQQLG